MTKLSATQVAPHVHRGGSHAASLLAGLNLQRKEAQFCDCVLRQKQNPDQLYPAHRSAPQFMFHPPNRYWQIFTFAVVYIFIHPLPDYLCRCVLAASSAVWASLLSSAGALVELQAPCLSDSVLGHVLEYIYTGAFPYINDHQQYSNLLAAASYLQMDELQETLQSKLHAAEYTEGCAERAEDQSYKLANSTRTNKCKQLSDTRHVNPQESEKRYWDDINMRRGSWETSSGSENASPNTSESAAASVETGSCWQAHVLAPQDLIQRISNTAEVHSMSGERNEVQQDQFHSADSWQMSEDELVWKVENRKSLYVLRGGKVQDEQTSKEVGTRSPCSRETEDSEEEQTARENIDTDYHCGHRRLSVSHLRDNISPSGGFFRSPPSSSHPRCGAVPVIRHSSTAAKDVSTVPSYHPVAQPSVSSGKASPSGGTDSCRDVESVTSEVKNRPAAQNQEDVNKAGNNGTQSCSYRDGSAQSPEQDSDYKSQENQNGMIAQDYGCCNTDEGRHKSRSSHIRDDHAHHCDSFQSHPKHVRTDLVAPNTDSHSIGCGPGSESKTSLDFHDFSSQPEQLHSFHADNVSMATVTEEQSSHPPDPHAAVPFPVQEMDTGSVSHFEELGPEREPKEEPSNSHGSPTEKNEQHSPSNHFGPWNEWYANLHRVEKSIASAACVQLGDKDGDAANVERENVSEQSPTSDVEAGFVGHMYCGHLHYHCLPQEDAHSDRRGSCSHLPKQPGQSSDEDEAGAALGPLRQHFASTEQVVLLDISTKPAELLVSYRSDKEEKWVALAQKDAFGNGPGNTADKPIGQEDEGKHEAGVRDGENQTTALTVCSPSGVPDYVQAPISSTLSVCIPSTLSVSVPTNISGQLSAPLHHPFQCSMCDRSFSQRGSLNRHVRSHLGIRPFPCPRCPMTFSRQYRVTEHMRVHQRFVPEGDFQKPSAPLI